VILIDSPAWVEFLRDTGGPVCDRVDALLMEGSEPANRSGWRYSPELETSDIPVNSADCWLARR